MPVSVSTSFLFFRLPYRKSSEGSVAIVDAQVIFYTEICSSRIRLDKHMTLAEIWSGRRRVQNTHKCAIESIEMDVPYAHRILIMKKNRSSSLLLLLSFHCVCVDIAGLFSKKRRKKDREEQRKNRVEGKKRSRQHRTAGQTRCCIQQGKNTSAQEREM